MTTNCSVVSAWTLSVVREAICWVLNAAMADVDRAVTNTVIFLFLDVPDAHY
jgi:hypothetical protein